MSLSEGVVEYECDQVDPRTGLGGKWRSFGCGKSNGKA